MKEPTTTSSRSFKSRIKRLETQLNLGGPCPAMRPIYVSKATFGDPSPVIRAADLAPCSLCGSPHEPFIHVVLHRAEAGTAPGGRVDAR